MADTATFQSAVSHSNTSLNHLCHVVVLRLRRPLPHVSTTSDLLPQPQPWCEHVGLCTVHVTRFCSRTPISANTGMSTCSVLMKENTPTVIHNW